MVGDKWLPVVGLRPGDQPGSISDNPPDGDRQVYLFEAGPQQATIVRSEAGLDIETDTTRVTYAAAGFVAVASLAAGESHELTVTAQNGEPRQFRFTYVDD